MTSFVFRQKGFTLIELLVVIAIIALLSSVVLASLSGARAKARDAIRKSDMRQITVAMEMYYNANSTYTITGTGWSPPACGCGWFNYEGGSYSKSIARGLVEAGAFSKAPIDPSIGGVITTTPQYMMYPCGADGYFAYAKLESPSASDIATYTKSKSLGCSNLDIYGMNYADGHI